jgi:hypothetical protein
MVNLKMLAFLFGTCAPKFQSHKLSPSSGWKGEGNFLNVESGGTSKTFVHSHKTACNIAVNRAVEYL